MRRPNFSSNESGFSKWRPRPKVRANRPEGLSRIQTAFVFAFARKSGIPTIVPSKKRSQSGGLANRFRHVQRAYLLLARLDRELPS
jgi:hypothetical protein